MDKLDFSAEWAIAARWHINATIEENRKMSIQELMELFSYGSWEKEGRVTLTIPADRAIEKRDTHFMFESENNVPVLYEDVRGEWTEATKLGAQRCWDYQAGSAFKNSKVELKSDPSGRSISITVPSGSPDGDDTPALQIEIHSKHPEATLSINGLSRFVLPHSVIRAMARDTFLHAYPDLEATHGHKSFLKADFARVTHEKTIQKNMERGR